jgi:hypothetical protein
VAWIVPGLAPAHFHVVRVENVVGHGPLVVRQVGTANSNPGVPAVPDEIDGACAVPVGLSRHRLAGQLAPHDQKKPPAGEQYQKNTTAPANHDGRSKRFEGKSVGLRLVPVLPTSHHHYVYVPLKVKNERENLRVHRHGYETIRVRQRGGGRDSRWREPSVVQEKAEMKR